MWQLIEKKRNVKGTNKDAPEIKILRHGDFSINQSFIKKFDIQKDTRVLIYINKAKRLIGLFFCPPGALTEEQLVNSRKLAWMKHTAKITSRVIFSQLGIKLNRMHIFKPVIEELMFVIPYDALLPHGTGNAVTLGPINNLRIMNG